MLRKKDSKPQAQITLDIDVASNISRKIPDSMETDEALAYNQNNLAVERTEFAKIRTDLALTNSRLAIDRTHLSYLRTIVSLIGSGATLYKALPLIAVSFTFTTMISGFLFLFAIYFIYKDATTYPKMKRKLHAMEKQTNELARKTESQIFQLDDDDD